MNNNDCQITDSEKRSLRIALINDAIHIIHNSGYSLPLFWIKDYVRMREFALYGQSMNVYSKEG